MDLGLRIPLENCALEEDITYLNPIDFRFEGKTVGQCYEKNGTLYFRGDFDKSADAFIDMVFQSWDNLKVRFKIPERVKIVYKDYEIVQKDEPVLLDRRESCGWICYEEGKIEISKKDHANKYERCRDAIDCTFWHEIVHGLNDEWDIFPPDAKGNPGISEAQVDKLAKALCTFIKDNPQMFKILREGGK